MGTDLTVPTPVSLTRESFLLQLLQHLRDCHDAVLGDALSDAFMAKVGQSVGEALEAEYKARLRIHRPFTVDEFAEVMVDVKRKIQGVFQIVSKSPEKVELRATRCPFQVTGGPPSFCRIGTSVFGGMAARNFGYGKVVLHRSLAAGDPECRITVYLQRTPAAEAEEGYEYVANPHPTSGPSSEELHVFDYLSKLRHDLALADSRWEEMVHGASEAIAAVLGGGVISFANERWRSLFGFVPAEMIGADLWAALHPDDRVRAREVHRAALQGRRTFGCPLRIQHREGHWCDVVASAGPLRTFRGEVAGVLWILLDETEKKEARRIKEELVPLVSHELRTPITNIKLSVELLRRLAAADSPDLAAINEKLDLVERQADRLTELVRKFLDFSRMRRDSFALNLEEHDLIDVVDQCIQRITREYTGHALQIRHRHEAETVFAWIDRSRIEQVVLNLLSNAVKYSPCVADVTVDTEIEREWVRIRVSDRGIGIPAYDRDRLFDPFYRGSNVTARHFDGLGLGLYLSQQIVRAHGGLLSVVSTPGEGTAVTLSLRRKGYLRSDE